MEGVLGGGESEAVVRALDAGCDCLLYPKELANSVAAVTRAIESGRLDEERIEGSLQRREHWADWAAVQPGDGAALPDMSEWAKKLADRTVHPIGGSIPKLRAPLRVITIDDDLGGPYPPPSRASFPDALIAGGATVTTDESAPVSEAGTTVIALYSDIRAWKGRPGYSEKAKERVRDLVGANKGKSVVVVLFSHPRLASSLGIDAPMLCAWGGEAVMQRAAARVLLQSV
jgi:hypothetical protein